MEDKDKETIGVLLLNLGGPDSLQAVRPFLNNLFSDREIIKLGPSFLQKPLAWLMSALRSQKTKKMYSRISGKSPILDITKAQAEALEKTLNQDRTAYSVQRTAENTVRSTQNSVLFFKVYIGMRYGHPFIKDTVQEIQRDGIKRLVILSLYPHYSKAATGSAIAEFKRAISRVKGQGSRVMIQYVESWYDFPLYIEALAELIYKGISEFDVKNNKNVIARSPEKSRDDEAIFKDEIPRPDKVGTRNDKSRGFFGVKDITILYSAHSLPESLIKEGDPYVEHIKATITAVNLSLISRLSSLPKWHLSFQSRSGPVRWLQPSTADMIKKLAKEGCKNLLIVPVSFVSDHIETLYEIDILYKKLAEKHGINLKRCQSLNVSEKFITALKELVMKNLE